MEHFLCKGACDVQQMLTRASSVSALTCSVFISTIFVVPWVLSFFMDFDHVLLRQFGIFSNSSNKALCDYTLGSWVFDESREPAYDRSCNYTIGFQCIDADGHIRNDTFRLWHWKPASCDLPPFDARRFVDMMHRVKRRRRQKEEGGGGAQTWGTRRKEEDGDFVTLGFVGDSLGQNMFRSLQCLIHSHLRVPDGTNFTEDVFIDVYERKDLRLRLRYIQEPYLVRLQVENDGAELLGETKRSNDVTVEEDPWWELHVDKLASSWIKELASFDLIVINSAHWWAPNKLFNRKIRFVSGGILQPDMKLEEAFELSMEFVSNYLIDLMQNNSFNGEAYFRSYSPDHFTSGAWNTGGRCDSLAPLTAEQLAWHRSHRDKLLPTALDKVYDRAKTRCPHCKIGYLRITEISDSRSDAHPANYTHWKNFGADCMHWCLPGVPDTWNEILAYLIRMMGEESEAAPINRWSRWSRWRPYW